MQCCQILSDKNPKISKISKIPRFFGKIPEENEKLKFFFPHFPKKSQKSPIKFQFLAKFSKIPRFWDFLKNPNEKKKSQNDFSNH